MKVLDLFSGTGSATQPFADAGHEVFRVDFDPQFPVDLQADVLELTTEDLDFGFDFVWASPPCDSFSVGAFRHHWKALGLCARCGEIMERLRGEKWAHTANDHIPLVKDSLSYSPKSSTGVIGQRLIAHTIRLVAGVNPPLGWLMENPRGLLRKLDLVKGLPRHEVTYCQYGDTRMKPTDLFGPGPDGWEPRQMCRNGDTCHEAAPRGAKTGTQGLNPVQRAMVPYSLGEDLVKTLSKGGTK